MDDSIAGSLAESPAHHETLCPVLPIPAAGARTFRSTCDHGQPRREDTHEMLPPLKIMPPPVKLATYDTRLFWRERLHRDRGNRWLRSLYVDRLATERCASKPTPSGTHGVSSFSRQRPRTIRFSSASLVRSPHERIS